MNGAHPAQVLLPPLVIPGQEMYPPGTTPDEINEMRQSLKYSKMLGYAMESCPLKVVIAGVGGLGLGGFFSLMSASFAYEDPLSRASTKLVGTKAQTIYLFKEMGRNMWSTGKGFGKVGALYAGTECCIEGYRAKNDLVNPIAGGFVTGALLARSSGPVSMLGGGAAFAVFSGAIDYWLRSPPKEEV